MSDRPSNVVQISYNDKAVNDFHQGIHDLLDTLPPTVSVATILGILEMVKLELFSAVPLASEVEVEYEGGGSDGDHTSPLER